MTMQKNVLSVVPGVMSLGLLSESTKMLPKKKLGDKTDFGPKKQIKGAMKMLVGVPLVGAVATEVNKVK